MKYLVLGSSGQIGLALSAYLKSIGHTVVDYDIAQNPAQDLRIANNTELDQLMHDCDFVFFLAWDVGGSTYLAKHQDSFEFLQNNLKIIVNTFELLHRHAKPFIFASSQMANMSYSSYGLSKSIAEKVTASLDGITVKFWNVYGIEHDPEKSHVITDFIVKAKTTGVIDMKTDGTELRQMLHADDCSHCLYTLSQQYQNLPRNKQYHITSFEWSSVLDIANLVSSHFPGSVVKPSDKKDEVQKDKRNEADPWILQYWKPQITLNQGIADIVKQMSTE